MTQGVLTAYWGAVAQIIPVLALAFVIEARVMVRRMSKKRAFKYRGQRIRTSMTLFVVGLLLIMSEFAALQGLSSKSDRPLKVIEYVYYWGSFVAVAFSLLVVVWYPIADMVVASTRDVVRWVQFHLPWGKAMRLRRTTLRQIETIDVTRRAARSARLDVLMICAMVLMEELDVEIVQKGLLLTSSERGYGAVDPTGELRKLAESDPHQPMWGYRVSRLLYENLVARDRVVRNLRKEFRRQLRHIDKITDVNSPEFVKLHRANMAAAAKMP